LRHNPVDVDDELAGEHVDDKQSVRLETVSNVGLKLRLASAWNTSPPISTKNVQSLLVCPMSTWLPTRSYSTLQETSVDWM